MIVEQIISDIQHDTDLRNGEVVLRAFSAKNIGCPKCHYPENAEKWDRLLWSHTHAHIEYCYWRRVYENILDDIPAKLVFFPQERHVIAWTRVHRSEIIYKETGKELRAMWPCADCIHRYNPTKRLRHLHGMRRIPEPEQIAF